MLDSNKTEGMRRCGLGEHARKDTPRYIYRFVLIATSLMFVYYYVAPGPKERD